MSRICALLVLIVAIAMTGCAWQTDFLNSKQPIAMQTAVSRAQFEMNCPGATGTVLSRDVIQPTYQGPWVGGIERAEFTIGVEGCGKRASLVVICPQYGVGCYATGTGTFHPNW